MKIMKKPDLTSRSGGWVQVAVALVGVGLSILAGLLLAQDPESPLRSNKPTTLAERGSFMSWFIGIRMIGPVFCWAGEREIRKESTEGGKSSGSPPDQEIFYEAGLHVLAVGPCEALHGIDQGGKTIMQGPINKDSHPSGSMVDLGKEGAFCIYWGEPDQPLNAYLGDPSRMDVTSRWPHVCYILWIKKRLSATPVWPILKYVVERRPQNTLLTQSQGWYDPGFTLSGTAHTVVDSLASSTPSIGYLEVSGDRTKEFLPNTQAEIIGNALPNGTYAVFKSEALQVQTGTNPLNGLPLFATRTRVFLEAGTIGADDQGTVEAYVADDSDGANIAHITADMLFEPYPQGLDIKPLNGVERWDVDSLELMGVEAEVDGWRSCVLAKEGEYAEAVLSSIMADTLCMLPIDPVTGWLTFQRVREPSGTIPNLGNQIYAGPDPEIETDHGEFATSIVVFGFDDRRQNYSTETIRESNDGEVSYESQFRAEQVPINTTVHFETASKVALLRYPTELSHAAAFDLTASREARERMPGTYVIADGFDEVLLVEAVQVDPDSEQVKLSVLPNAYGLPKSTFSHTQGVTPPPVQDPLPDEAIAFFEIPSVLLGSFPGTQTLMVAHIRAHDQITFATVWTSPDNLSYTLQSNTIQYQTGGTLDAELPDTGSLFVAQGPEYTELGPDNGTLTQDLTGDEPNWYAGKQLAVIVSAAGIEVCYVQNTPIVSGSTRRLDGFIRARYGTRRLTHPAGSNVFIFDVAAISTVQDNLLQPGVDVYLKTQPGTTSGQVSLAAVSPYSAPIYGLGNKPAIPDGMRVTAPFLNVPAFNAGDDITLAWAVNEATSLGTGAGYQNAGTSLMDPVIPGTLVLEFFTLADALQRTVTIPALDPTYTYTNADLVADFGGEQSFKVSVTHVTNGLSSDPSPKLTVTLV